MSSDAPESAPSSTVDAGGHLPGLGQSAFKGFTLIAASTVGVKGFALLGQIIVARMLAPEDFGMVALAYSVLAFTGVFEKNGLREVLVQRGGRFADHANAAFWMTLATGLLVAGATLAAIPFAVRLYRTPGLRSVLALLALSITLLSLQSVPGARLQHDLRFRTLALVGVVESLGLNVLAVALAVLGAGVYSIVVPTLVVRAASLAWQWRLSRFVPALTLDRPRWRGLFGSSALLFGSSALLAVQFGGASMVLGIFHDVTVVGIFSFSYNLSAQLTGLLTNNLWTVLLPTFSRLGKSPTLQAAAFLRVARAANLVGIPACFLLAAVADPALRLLYGHRWEAAVPVVQIIAVGMAFNVSFTLSHNLLMAQGRYLALFWFNVWRVAGFMLLVGAGAWWGGAVAVGWATAVFAAVYGPAMTFLALRPTGGTWQDVGGIHAAPLAVGGMACGLAAAAAGAVPVIGRQPWLHLASIPVLSLLAGLPLGRWLMRPTWDELADRLRRLLVSRPVRSVA